MSTPVRIPADVEREDTILAGLTARQLLLLSGAGTILYGLFTATRPFLPVAVFLIAAVPLAGLAALLARGRRDGLPLDRLVLAAIRQHMACLLYPSPGPRGRQKSRIASFSFKKKTPNSTHSPPLSLLCCHCSHPTRPTSPGSPPGASPPRPCNCPPSPSPKRA
ncbi:PrgI family protein [Streptomyces specialis]|uniref:PrgI family protein n=1 Tax=Streptomyces specialis TaxID=498367 RepID=UPI00099E6C65|nr:PrgI family protein [Streptomyces specialis]